MTIEEIKKKIESDEYGFLRKEPLKDNVILLGLGGSYAYGTNTENSDLDVRGIAVHSGEDILARKGFEQVIDNATDTTVYSLEKIVNLLANCNPNVIEILGLEPWQYLHLSDEGKLLLENREIFLSKRAIYSFGGYATSQLRRLTNKSARKLPQGEHEKYILQSIDNARQTFPEKYFQYPEDSIKLYVDKSEKDDMESEIFMDVNLKHYPLRDYKAMWSEMNDIVKSYAGIGKRNTHAASHDKLGKHMMHLVRLYLMCFDILEKGEIVTYRAKEHDMLMDIRNGKYLDDDSQPTKEFNDMLDDLESRLEYWKEHTELPEKPDYKKINALLVGINCNAVAQWFLDKFGSFDGGV